MAWTALVLTAPSGSAASLAAGLGGAVSVWSLHPWDAAVRDGHGPVSYLSFPNAAAALSARVRGEPATLAVAVAGSSLIEFRAALEAFYGAFPLQHLGFCARRARALESLEADKLALPATARAGGRAWSVGGLPMAAAVKRAALRQLAAAEAAALPVNPLSRLTALQATAATAASGTAAALTTATGAIASAGAGLLPGTCWRCYAEGDPAEALASGGPGHERTLTALVAFTGSPSALAVLRGMLA